MALTDDDKQWFSEQLKGIETKLLTQFHEERQWTSEQLEALETKLLTEFHKWASPFESRQRRSAALRAYDLELEDLSDRVKKLEGRRNDQREPGIRSRHRAVPMADR